MHRQSIIFCSLATALLCLNVAVSASGAAETPAPAVEDTTLGLAGGGKESSLRSLTIEAENRMQIRFERPKLAVDIDPASAPGLDWGDPLEVLDRTVPDLDAPLLASTSGLESPYTARPWLRGYREGTVATFQPQLENVERWRLVVANARGEEVQVFEGKGKPPKEIEWNGRTKDGELASPGLVHSYVLEAHDRAGNRRNFAGDSFELPPFRIGGVTSPRMVLAGKHLEGETSDGIPVLLLEAVSRVNQVEDVQRPVRVTVLARSHAQAEALAQRVTAALTPRLLGPATRVMAFTQVAADAPETGVIEVSALP